MTTTSKTNSPCVVDSSNATAATADRMRIRLDPELHEIGDAAVAAVARIPGIYVRGGCLTRIVAVVRAPRVQPRHGHDQLRGGARRRLREARVDERALLVRVDDAVKLPALEIGGGRREEREVEAALDDSVGDRLVGEEPNAASRLDDADERLEIRLGRFLVVGFDRRLRGHGECTLGCRGEGSARG